MLPPTFWDLERRKKKKKKKQVELRVTISFPCRQGRYDIIADGGRIQLFQQPACPRRNCILFFLPDQNPTRGLCPASHLEGSVLWKIVFSAQSFTPYCIHVPCHVTLWSLPGKEQAGCISYPFTLGFIMWLGLANSMRQSDHVLVLSLGVMRPCMFLLCSLKPQLIIKRNFPRELLPAHLSHRTNTPEQPCAQGS